MLIEALINPSSQKTEDSDEFCFLGNGGSKGSGEARAPHWRGSAQATAHQARLPVARGSQVELGLRKLMSGSSGVIFWRLDSSTKHRVCSFLLTIVLIHRQFGSSSWKGYGDIAVG